MTDDYTLPLHLRVIKTVLGFLVRRIFRVQLSGLENLTEAGMGRVLMVNHPSSLDPLLLATLLPGQINFVINYFVAMRWWVRLWLFFGHVYRVDTIKPYETNTLIKDLRKGRTVIIFPEGRFSITGSLMKIYEGAALVIDKSEATVIPIHIEGAQYSYFSSLKGKVKRSWFPRISITIHKPRSLVLDASLSGHHRRQAAGTWLYDEMCEAAFESKNRQRTLFDALLDAKRQYGSSKKIIEDMNWHLMSYNRLLIGSIVLGRHLSRDTKLDEAVGILLPNLTITAVVWMALQAIGRVAAMLNYTFGPEVVLTMCRTAQVRTVLTARKFVKEANLEAHIETLEGVVTIIYLEDLKKAITLKDKIIGMWIAKFSARSMSKKFPRLPTDPAVILFTSGSESTPKGVVLSHHNLLTNIAQVAARLDITPADKVLNVLPIFHSFGFTFGLMMPLLLGVRVFLYISPLHYKVIPELAYHTNATIFFAADTFLAALGRQAHAYDFISIRYVFAGAEALRTQTWQMWLERFGIRILQGYGVTETSPVISVNTPMYHRKETIGRLMPGIKIDIVPVEGINQGGCLWIKGDNVMLGYLRAERPGIIEPPKDGWHDTGDIVRLETEGYLRIIGRVKRFAKIAGEMISLSEVESTIAQLWPDYHHAVLAYPDERKGEQLVLVTTNPTIERTTLAEQIQQLGYPTLFVPRQICIIEVMPLFTTGKINYPALKDLVILDQSLNK